MVDLMMRNQFQEDGSNGWDIHMCLFRMSANRAPLNVFQDDFRMSGKIKFFKKNYKIPRKK